MARLVANARQLNADLLSSMVKLTVSNSAERWLIPAFVFLLPEAVSAGVDCAARCGHRRRGGGLHAGAPRSLGAQRRPCRHPRADHR